EWQQCEIKRILDVKFVWLCFILTNLFIKIWTKQADFVSLKQKRNCGKIRNEAFR
ncbi:unnamed protein product, partial [Larinioides sclopetarius]